MSLPSILDDERVAAAIEHNLKCGACGAPATHEQCGGALVCDAHIMPGRAWTIDSKTIELHAQAVGAVVLVAARAVASLGTFVVRGIVRKAARTTRAGFVYFDLEDESGARLRCRAAGIEIASGALTVRGDLSVFVGTGDLQFNVVEIVP